MFHGDVLPDAGDGEWVAPHRVRLEEARLGLVRGPVRGEARSRRWRARSSPSSKPWSTCTPCARDCGPRSSPPCTAAAARPTRWVPTPACAPRSPSSSGSSQVRRCGPWSTKSCSTTPSSTAPDRRSDTARPRVSHLPALTSPMTGRDIDLAAVSQRTAHERLVTLVGPAGIGKTRLAVEVATIVERTDGACLVRLEGARNAATVLTAIAEALDVNPRTDVSVIDHLRGSDLLARPRQLRAGRRRRRRLRHPPDRRRPVGERAVHQPAAARTRRRVGLPPRTTLARRLGPAVRATSIPAPTRIRPTRGHGVDRRVGLSIARRSPAGDRARRGADTDVVGRRDRPTTGRPLRPAARSNQPPTRSPAGPRGSDLLELRPAVPRRPARPVGTRLLR